MTQFRPSSPPAPPAWRRHRCTFTALALLASSGAPIAGAQTTGWQKGIYLDPAGTSPPFIYVVQPRTGNPTWRGFGLDAADDVGQYALGEPNRKLMFMSKDRAQPELLFPRPIHQAAPLNLPGPLDDGAVHEPTVYHDVANNRFWAIFSYAWDLRNRSLAEPCEIYALDLTDAMTNPTTFNPDTAAVVRLTHSATSAPQLFERSFNPRLAPQHPWQTLVAWAGVGGIQNYPQLNTGACVVDEEHGPVLYFASNERRTDGLGMMAGDLRFTDTAPFIELLHHREIQQFGTTSLISFFETPRGAGGAYRSSTEAEGQWGVFEFRSDEAFWQTVSGYFNQINFADHNGTTLAIGDDLNDSVLAISRYYINNNQSFGTVILVPYDKAGLNSDNGQGGDYAIQQVGALPGEALNLFPEIPMTQDIASPVGKFAAPAGGRRGATAADSELYLSYSPLGSYLANENAYHAKLVAVKGIHQPITTGGSGSFLPTSPTASDRVRLVLEHPNSHAFSMRPILTHAERFGWDHREVDPLIGRGIADSVPDYLADLPVAQVMAGPIYKTDIRSYGRRKQAGGASTDKFDPTTFPRNNSGDDKMVARVSCLTKLLDHTQLEDDVWGMRIFVTDAKARKFNAGDPRRVETTSQWGSRWGYLHHDGSGAHPFGDPIHHERYRLLSDVPITQDPDIDGLVNFLLPAGVPVKFNLLHEDGTILAAHRNHHSFAPGQLEQRCAGCHDHTDRSAAPFVPVTGQAFDTLTQTGRYSWDPGGGTMFKIADVPTLPVPEFKADIWPLMQTHCASCHDSAAPRHPLMDGVQKFDMNMQHPADWDQRTAVWSWLNRQHYINRREGSVRSPFAWHFTGLASDQAVRLDNETNARYRNDPGSVYWTTTSFPPGLGTNPHPGIADREAAYKVLEWIDSGAAIDHEPTQIGTPLGGQAPDPTQGVKGDGYQIGLMARLDDFLSFQMRIGYWDVDGNVDTVEVAIGSSRIAYSGLSASGNGSLSHDLGSHAAQLGRLPEQFDTIEVVATDTAGNRSVLRKSLSHLMTEAERYRGTVKLTADTLSVTPGTTMDTVTFQVNAGPGLAGASVLMVMGGALHDADFPVFSQSIAGDTGVWVFPRLDAWRVAGYSLGLLGPLDAGGQGNFATQIPVGTPAEDLYINACVLTADGNLAKSGILRLKIE